MFSSIESFGKFFKPKKVSTQDFVFALHSKVTFVLLLLSSVLLSLKQYFGEPIKCRGSDERDEKWAEQYCWSHGAYIFNYKFQQINAIKEDNENFVAYGIYSLSNLRARIKPTDQDRIYLRYYQWVVLILVIQAFIFALPGFIWKLWEKKRLQQLCEELDVVLFDNNCENQNFRIKYIQKYFTSGMNDINLCYALKYGLCELFNFLICILNVIMMNMFFINFWSNYGSVITSIPLYDWNEYNFRSSFVFPKVVKCDTHYFGASGTVEARSFLCLLPLNILNEKLFVFFYIWFLCLTTLSGLNVIFRISVMAFKPLRVQLLRAQARYLKSNEIANILQYLNYGDWYLLYKICGNINPLSFKELWYELKPLEKSNFTKSDI